MNWTTPNTTIPTNADHAITLRQFRPSSLNANDTLILPPQAGHGGEVADWPVPGRSLVQCLLENTAGGVYVVDWQSCTWLRRNETYEDLVNQVRAAIAELSGSVNLIGLCQGGTLATIYTALYPEDVAHLVPVGCPIDPHASDSDLSAAMKMPYTSYKMLVMAQFGLVRGDWMLANWKSLNWASHYVERYTKPSEKKELFYSWYDDTRDIAGGWYLNLMKQLFLENRLIRNEFVVGNETVDLREIKCPVSLVAGGKDTISPPEHVFALKEHVPHAVMYIVKGKGHIGCFNSAQANSVVMPEICRQF